MARASCGVAGLAGDLAAVVAYRLGRRGLLDGAASHLRNVW